MTMVNYKSCQSRIDWHPIEKIDNFNLNNFSDYIFYDKSGNYLIGRTDIDGNIEIGRISYSKNYLKGICAHFAELNPPKELHWITGCQ